MVCVWNHLNAFISLSILLDIFDYLYRYCVLEHMLLIILN